MEHVADITRIIQLAVAPVFLLTAIGTILSALNNRLGRIVDRRRVIEERVRKGEQDDEGRQADVQELELLKRRIGLIYHAIVMAVVCALLICLLVASLAAFPTGKRLRFVLPLEASVLAAAFGERLVTTYVPGMFAPYAGAVVMIVVGLVILAYKLRINQWFGGVPKRAEMRA